MALDSSGAQFDETVFRSDVQAFLDDALTPELRAAGRATVGVYSEVDACRVWHRRLYERGWIAPAWPVAWGGAGWCARRRHIFDEACADNDAPLLFAAAIRSLGPLLIEQGTDRQRDLYLPRILSGEHFWSRAFPNLGPGPIWRPCRRAPTASATSTASTARRSGPRAPILPTTCSLSCAPNAVRASKTGSPFSWWT
jgi:hypothetical protein